jgi:spore germination protein YaaH
VILLTVNTGSLNLTLSKYFFQNKKPEPLSPLSFPGVNVTRDKISQKSSVLSSEDQRPLTEVIGFLPYWKLTEARIPFEKVKTIAFFGVTVDKNGRIAKMDQDGNEDPGWGKFKSKEFDNLLTNTHQSGVKVHLVLRLMNNNDIIAVINNPLARQNTRENIVSLVREKNLDGINIDIEYQGVPDPSTIKNFTVFIKEFQEFLSRSQSKTSLTLDVQADSVVKTRLFELEKLHPYLNFIIIMGYDFFRSASTNSGPVAPLTGKEIFGYDVTKAVTDFVKTVPPEKLILGIPFYGYEWETETAKPGSKTIPNTGALATYGRVQKIIIDKHLVPKLDEVSQEPYLIFEEQGALHQIFFEDENSLTKKISLVKKSGIAGIAIWALGYEGDSPQIWQIIK